LKNAVNKSFATYKKGEINKVELSTSKEKIEVQYTKDGEIRKRTIKTEKEKD
jgi:hypothetical protein